MVQDRRHFQRVGLNSPLSVLLDESNYSFVFDLCEEGLAVCELAARSPNEVIPFAFDLPEGKGCIQGRAEIVWTNESEHRTGLHFVDLAGTSREHLIEWIAARACITTLVGAEKEPIQLAAVTHAIDGLINPIFQDSRDKSEGRSVPSLVPRSLTEEFEPKDPELRSAEVLKSYSKSSYTIGVALATVLLFSAFGFLGYYLIWMRNSPQARDRTVAPKAHEWESKDTISSVNPSSAIAPFFTPTSPLDLTGFVLQVGAMRHEENADALAEDLRHRNFPAFVFWRGTDPFYRVAVGPYSDRDSAERVKNELKKQGLKAFLRRWVPE
jgi:SPOR domain/PilZ domain